MENRNVVINDIRKVLNWLEAHPDVPMPCGFEDIAIYPDGRDEFLLIAHRMGSFKKYSDDSFFHVKKEFGTVTVRASEWRHKVCTRKQVGVREIEEKVPTAFEIQKKEVPVYEWECPESLLEKREEVSDGSSV